MSQQMHASSLPLVDSIRSTRIRIANLIKGLEHMERRLESLDFDAYCQLLREPSPTHITGSMTPVRLPAQRLNPPRKQPSPRDFYTDTPTTRLPNTNSMPKLAPKVFESNNQHELLTRAAFYINTHENSHLTVQVSKDNYTYLALLVNRKYLTISTEVGNTKIICKIQ